MATKAKVDNQVIGSNKDYPPGDHLWKFGVSIFQSSEDTFKNTFFTHFLENKNGCHGNQFS